MRFGVRLPGPFFAVFGRSARGQARRNLAVRAHEQRIVAEIAQREKHHQEVMANARESAHHYFGGPGVLRYCARMFIGWTSLLRIRPILALFVAFVVVGIPAAIIQAVVSGLR
jgi:hypothetical protein